MREQIYDIARPHILTAALGYGVIDYYQLHGRMTDIGEYDDCHYERDYSTKGNFSSVAWASQDGAYNASNCSFDYDFRYEGDKSVFPKWTQSLLITLYTFTGVLSLIGNLLVIIALTMGTSSWKHLRQFLVNLAASDLLITVFCIPFTFTMTVLGEWHFGGFMCTFVTFMQYLAVSVSVFTNMAIGLDRYWAVVHPMKARLTTGQVRIVIVVIWLVAFVVSSPQLKVSRQELHLGYICKEVWPNQLQNLIYTFTVLAVTYVIPLFILALTYSAVGLRLWERTHPGEASSTRDDRQTQSKKKVIKMLLAIVIAFGFCWLPIHMFDLIRRVRPDYFYRETAQEEVMLSSLFTLCHWIATAHSFVNPIIYGFLHEKFRKDVRMIARYCFHWSCCPRCQDSWTNYSRHSWTTRSRLRLNTWETYRRAPGHSEKLQRTSTTNSSNSNTLSYKRASKYDETEHCNNIDALTSVRTESSSASDQMVVTTV